MPASPLSKIDLNLLVVLDVLLREQSVARTAEKLNLTSSAVSHALKRLRLLFDNELLVRDGRRMVPTARGQSLADTLPSLLLKIERTLAAPEPFEPSTSTRRFRLVAPDFISPLLPPLLRAISNEAPGVNVEIVGHPPTAKVDMQNGRYDLYFAPSFKQTDDLRGVELGAWPWVAYGRKDHPAFSNWSLENWARFPHIMVSASSPSGSNPLDQAASRHGATRNIGVVIPNFSMAAPILATTDMLLTVPSIAMHGLSTVFGLAHQDLPFEIPRLQLSLFCSATTSDEPDIRWFRSHIINAVDALVT